MKSKNKLLFVLVPLVAVAFSVGYYFFKSRPQTVEFRWDDIFVEQISFKFHSYATKVNGRQSLQVARLNQMEVYERTSQAKALGISLPEVVVRAEFPVEYNFNVSLLLPWNFKRGPEELIVTVPEISSQAPAINVSALKLVVKKGSFLRNEQEAKEKLQAELNTFVIDNSIRLRETVREQARESLRQFLVTWLAQTMGQEFPKNVRVFFRGEGIEGVAPAAVQ